MSRSEYPADAFAAVSGSSVHLLREKPPEDGSSSCGAAPAAAFGEVVVSHSCTVNTARWNRNNKVVAAGCADGHVQLLHSGGQVMCVLPRDGSPPSAVGPVTSLSWSSGSKRLAAGSANGSVFIYDMQQKQPTAELGGHVGGVTALEYQADDKFLAVASGSGSIVLYPDPHRPGGGAAVPLPPSASGPSARLCMALGASEPVLAAGSSQGAVAVWDMPSLRLREEYAGQHGGAAVHALAFVPLRPAWLYSAGADGRVCLQDRHAGPGHVSTISVRAPATALMVKEDHSVIGVGTAGGVVLLYDPRRTQQPLHSFQLSDRAPVSALHWQHRYASLSGSRHHARSAASAHAPAPHTSTSTQPQINAGTQPPASTGRQPAGPSRLGASSSAAVDVPPSGASAAARSHAATAHLQGSPAPAAAGAASGALPLHSVAAAQAHMPLAAAAAANAADKPPHVAAAAPGPVPLAITPLPGMPPPRYPAGGGHGAAEFTPVQQQRPVQQQQPQAAVQQLVMTPLGGTQAQSAAQSGRTAGGGKSQPTPSPLQQLAGAVPPPELNITPLPAPAPRVARVLPPVPPAASGSAGTAGAAGTASAAGAAGAAGTVRPPLRLDISPLPGVGGGGGGASLAISPLPGMHLPAAASQPGVSPKQQQQQQRSVLGERTNSSSAMAGHGHGMLAPLSAPLPTAAEEEAAQHEHLQLQSSPSFAENSPLPLPSPRSPASRVPEAVAPHPRAGFGGGGGGGGGAALGVPELAGHKLKAAALAQTQAVEALSPAGSDCQQEGGGGGRWSISAIPAEERLTANGAAGSHPQPVAPQQGEGQAYQAGASTARERSSEAQEFSFVAAEQSYRQLSGGAGLWLGGGGGGGGGSAAAAAAAAPPAGLRDDILAMHLDMLNQFQAQQASMGQLVSQLMQRNDNLTGEVAALRKQLATLTHRRDTFLWL